MHAFPNFNLSFYVQKIVLKLPENMDALEIKEIITSKSILQQLIQSKASGSGPQTEEIKMLLI